MKLGTLPRGLAVAAVAAVTVVPLAASAASAAPAAPTAYSVFGSAAPLVWADSSSIPVGDVHVPFVAGKTNNLAAASSYSSLAVQLFDVLRGLSLAGVSMLVIDQFVNLALGVADWAIVVENRRVCVCSAPGELAPSDVSWQSTHPDGGDSASRSKGAPG